MANRNLLTEDYQYIVFKEVYNKLATPKAERQALQLVKSCIESFSKKGFSGNNLASLARFSGVTPQKLRYYLGTYNDIFIISMKYSRVLYQDYVIKAVNNSKASSPNDILNVYTTACLEWPRLMGVHTTFWIKVLSETRDRKLIREINTEATQVGRRRLANLLTRVFKPESQSDIDSIQSKSSIIHALITGYILTESTENNSNTEQSHKNLTNTIKLLVQHNF